jgi:Trp operon repressor
MMDFCLFVTLTAFAVSLVALRTVRASIRTQSHALKLHEVECEEPAFQFHRDLDALTKKFGRVELLEVKMERAQARWFDDRPSIELAARSAGKDQLEALATGMVEFQGLFSAMRDRQRAHDQLVGGHYHYICELTRRAIQHESRLIILQASVAKLEREALGDRAQILALPQIVADLAAIEQRASIHASALRGVVTRQVIHASDLADIYGCDKKDAALALTRLMPTTAA